MARIAAKVIGVVFILVGFAGFFHYHLLGAHLSVAHNVVHLVSGALALYFGTAGTLKGAKIFCLAFGVVYFLLGVAGFVAGVTATPTLLGAPGFDADPRLLRVVPGYLELGTADHLIHIAIGLLFIVAGALTKTALGRYEETRAAF
jgi:hypothetical protein